MYRKTVLVVLAFAFLGFWPRQSEAQFLATYIFQPPKQSDFLIMPGVALQVVKVDRLGIGAGFHVGGVWDKADPSRKGRHVHLSWMPTVNATFRLGESWGVVGGYGWGFLKADAKTHLSNYRTSFAGLAFGLKP